MSTKKRVQAGLRKALHYGEWPKDVTRHTCATYWLAATNDINLVSRMLGNSPEILRRHYLELVKREQAEEFWAIAPRESRP